MVTQTFSQTFLGGRVTVKVGDITVEEVDAIVNAANSTLMGGGGVDGAIHRRGGKTILEECKKIKQRQYPNGLPAGEAVITKGGNLPAKYVIHTVGPVWSGGNQGEKDTLRSCYTKSLECAERNNLSTVAFPAISTGVYRFPKELAAEISSEAIRSFLQAHEKIKEVRLVFFSGVEASVFFSHHVF